MSAPSSANRLVVVAGLPGAGKSTLLARLSDAPPVVGDGTPAPRVLDPDLLRNQLARRLPRVPYRAYRGVVHGLHVLWSLLQIMLGPRHPGDVLLVHATTRRTRRERLARFARAYGWSPSLVVLDVGVGDALAGQADRGRVVNEAGFGRHVRRWTRDQADLRAVDGGPDGPWDAVLVVPRRAALRRVRALLVQDVCAPGLPRVSAGGYSFPDGKGQ